jgi:triacylglycerol lipase
MVRALVRQGRVKLEPLAVVGREVKAFAHQAWLLHHDVGPIAPAELPRAGADVVVLLHGLFASAGVLRPMKREIERATGAVTASFSYPPGPGVGELAERLDALIGALPGDARVHLVGHSLGGLVARWWAHSRTRDPRVVQTISLASPFNGTRHARVFPVGAARDITPGSPLLTQLALSARSAALPHLSIVAEYDSVVTERAALDGDEVIVVPGLGHNGLLFDVRVASVIASRLHTLGDAQRAA